MDLRNILLTILKNFGALLLGCCIGFLTFEFGLRIFNPLESRVKGNSIVLPANKKYEFANYSIAKLDSQIVHTKNSLGFRGPELPAESLDSYIRILTIGGSTTECSFLSDSEDWPAILAMKLKQDFDNIWLNNAGLDGHSTFGHIILLNDYVVKLRPDIVMFLIGRNEIGKLQDTEHTNGQIKSGIRLNSMEGFIKSMAAYSETVHLLLSFYRYQRARSQGLPHQSVDLKQLASVENPVDHLTEKIAIHKTKYLPAYKERLREVIEICKSDGIEPIFITQPALFGEGKDDVTSVDLASIKVGDSSGYVHWKILQLYNDVTREIARNENIIVVDLAVKMKKSSRFYYDFIHYTESGAREVASIVYDEIRPFIQKKIPPQRNNNTNLNR